MAKIVAYVDGFNFYYGAVKNTKHKWLNLLEFLQRSFPADTIQRVKYCTALASSWLGDPEVHIRQQLYWRALRTLKIVEIIEGSFLSKPKRIALANPERSPFRTWLMSKIHPNIMRLPNGVYLAKVMRTEEKGSDVNVAAHLIHDAHQGVFDRAVVVSGDSDLAGAIRIVVKEIGLPVHLLNPQKRPSGRLNKAASSYSEIDRTLLPACQFPSPMTDKKGQFDMPRGWV